MSVFKMGIMSCPAFSGMPPHVNRRASACIPDFGPIPPGRYYILDRQSGGFLGPLWDRIKGHQDWFALYADDNKIDDHVYCNQVERGNFRLHPKVGLGLSKGCITIENRSDFVHIHGAIKSVRPVLVDGTDVLAYGAVVVQ